MEPARKLDDCEYRRREPEQALLHRALCAHLETFLNRVHTEDSAMPDHVVKELREYLTCGVLAHGFVRIHCEKCGKSIAVEYSCKGRGYAKYTNMLSTRATTRCKLSKLRLIITTWEEHLLRIFIGD